MLKKLKIPYTMTLIVITIFYINFQLDENILFFADNSTKYFQGIAVIYNHFKDDTIRCQWLSDFNYCKYFIFTNTMERKGDTIVGAFPFALSYLNGLIIQYLGHEWILWLPEILFVLMVLFLYHYKLLDQSLIFILFFLTPLFLQFYTFFDVALQIFFLNFLWIYLTKLKINEINPFSAFLLGFLTGLNFYFRMEGIFYLFFVVGLFFLLDKNKKFHFIYGFGILVSMILLLGLNSYFYNTIFGNRILMNLDSIFNFKNKMSNVVSILFGNSWRVGYFFYMPVFLWVYLFAILHFKKMDLFWKIQLISILVSMIFLVFLAPNDSNVDYGTRYLSSLIIPSLLLYDFLKRDSLKKRRVLNFLIFILLMVSAYFSYQYFNKMVFKVNRDAGLIYNQIPEEFRNNTVWVFHSNFVPSLMGAYLMDNKSIIVEHLDEVEDVINIINKKDDFKKVLVFHSYFYLNLQYPDEQKLSDRFFYEDDLVKEEFLSKLKASNFALLKKEIFVRNKKVFDVFTLKKSM
ncbi:MAG: LA_3751/LA_3752 family putative glycosyltransferase [Leptonema sp. (in: bacteria)]